MDSRVQQRNRRAREDLGRPQPGAAVSGARRADARDGVGVARRIAERGAVQVHDQLAVVVRAALRVALQPLLNSWHSKSNLINTFETEHLSRFIRSRNIKR